MKTRKRFLLVCLVIAFFGGLSLPQAETGKTPPVAAFRMHIINEDSKFEAAAILDVNRDGRLDIFCGGFWYEAPSWTKHFVREIQQQDEYYLDFAALPADVDQDGWTDVISAAWHNKSVFWVRNPAKSGKGFEVFPIDQPGNIETALLADVNGDGKMDVFPNVVTDVVWYEYTKDRQAPQGVRWIRHDVSKEAAGHGLGAGDVNGDGRCDLVVPKGWLEQPANSSGKWEYHQDFDLGSTGVPILVHDVDRDGDADLVFGMGHNYGIYWLEQGKDPSGKRTWEKHEIDKEWSQVHFLLLADLDNDGTKEVVTGKRYRAHNGKDPGENDPRCIYYYSFDSTRRHWTRHIISQGGKAGFGISTMAADIDKDGDVDVVAPGKSGLYLFENLLRKK
jgi:hypothetical protein